MTNTTTNTAVDLGGGWRLEARPLHPGEESALWLPETLVWPNGEHQMAVTAKHAAMLRDLAARLASATATRALTFPEGEAYVLAQRVGELKKALQLAHDVLDDANANGQLGDASLCCWCQAGAYDGEQGVLHQPDCPLLVIRKVLAWQARAGIA